MTLLSSLVPNSIKLTVADTNATPLANIKEVAYASLTAPRTVTLPLAVNVLSGNAIIIIDESGNCSATNTITIQVQGSDLLNGSTNYVLSVPYGTVSFESNGTNGWFSLAPLSVTDAPTLGQVLAQAIRN